MYRTELNVMLYNDHRCAIKLCLCILISMYNYLQPSSSGHLYINIQNNNHRDNLQQDFPVRIQRSHRRGRPAYSFKLAR